MKQILKDFKEEHGYEFTWETYCLECGMDFRCEQYIPDRIIKKMLEKESNDVISEFIDNTEDERFHYCPDCRKELGLD